MQPARAEPVGQEEGRHRRAKGVVLSSKTGEVDPSRQKKFGAGCITAIPRGELRRHGGRRRPGEAERASGEEGAA